MLNRVTLTFLLLCALGLTGCKPDGEAQDAPPLRCAISMAGGDANGSRLLFGYNYDLLRRYSRESGRKAEIRMAGRRESVLDSLKSSSLDVVALPFASAPIDDSTLVCVPADSCGYWVFSTAGAEEAQEAGKWMKELREVPEYASLRQSYLDIYNPLTRVSADFISPYDSLIRVYADTLGWDWKLLAALVYQESKFHIEARSPKGAFGLMQLLPDTAAQYGCTDRLDPEQNIRAGVMMLKAVEDRYRKLAADKHELTRFTLAGYNAGTGRLKDCIGYARHLGYDVSRWENVAKAIPDMKHDSIAALDAIRLGAFNGSETLSFVRKISAFHERYRHICP